MSQPGVNVPNVTNMNQQPNATPTSLQPFNNSMHQQPIRMNNNIMVTSMQDFLNSSNNIFSNTFLTSDSTTNANNKLFPNI